MNHFDHVKRDPWMTEHNYRTSTASKEAEFSDPAIHDLLAGSHDTRHHYQGLSRDWACMALELAMQRYSGGEPLELVSTYVDYAFIHFQRHFDAYPATEAKLRPWRRDEYQYIVWLLSLAVLFGYPDRVEQLTRWIDHEDERGHDALLHRLFKRLGQPFPAKPLIYPESHAPLLEALDLRRSAQQERFLRYVESWYATTKACYWHDRHRRSRADHLGYWAFEAALVAFLWGVDDASVRKAHHYPTALIDKALDRRLDRLYLNEETTKMNQAPHHPSGALCPWPGHYICVERGSAEQFFHAQHSISPGRWRNGALATGTQLLTPEHSPTRYSQFYTAQPSQDPHLSGTHHACRRSCRT